jgi:hypothetical protein
MTDPCPNKNGLIAIALVIRSKDGPRFVYHYPPHPTTKAPKRDHRFGTELDDELETNLDGDGEDSDPEDEVYQINPTFGKLTMEEKTNKKSTESFEDNHFESPTGDHIVPWEHLGEFLTTDLESILTPSRAYKKKKFELSLDPLNFVTYPIHIREDGFWTKKRTKKSKKAKNEEVESVEDKPGSGEKKEESIAKLSESDDGDDIGGMTMFNVVFILNLPIDEEDKRIKEIYDNVIKDLNKALLHAQASSNYVWKESEMILGMKEKAREESEFSVYVKWQMLTASRTSHELALEPDYDQIDPCCSNWRYIHSNIYQ